MKTAIPFLLILAFVFPSTVQAKSVMVATKEAQLHVSPSLSSTAVLEVPLFYPLEVLGETDQFFHVLDFMQRNGWVPKIFTEQSRSAVVKVAIANIRQGPGKENEVIFKAQQGVSFKVTNEQGEWLNILHEDGESGWVHKNIMWGY